ncbi:SP0191 family lipoprotein [Streptococcus himalayensis]|uniref:SP-0191-like C-terminal domain-containing protein n=1 Tax=Streptococcus himalayensis TaxID=1888195 RepID=A0A917EG63_9STRE|nr:SP0191 family lipoprotein [Streptococcus himalayensis]GGE36058.1 hypothetical protein GCM10011510_16750 [Streptococcus himalayensis]
MKKVIPLVLLGWMCLTGCFLNAKGKNSLKTSSSQETSLSKTAESSSTEELQEMVTRTFAGEVNGTTRQDMITYQGKKILHLKLKLIGNLPENMRAVADNLTLEQLRQVFQEGVEKNEAYQSVAAMEGVNVLYQITEDRRLQADIDLDIDKMDTSQLKSLPMFSDIPLKEIQEMSPVTYIAGLKVIGLSEVTDDSAVEKGEGQ